MAARLACRHTRIASDDHCRICRATASLGRYIVGVTALSRSQAPGQTMFIFECGIGHKFVSDGRARGCPMCRVMEYVYSIMGICDIYPDADTVYIDSNTLVRMRCSKHMHCRGCTGAPWRPGRPCCNYRVCNSEFVMRASMARYACADEELRGGARGAIPQVLSCQHAHTWSRWRGVPNAIRALEILYGAKFNDYAGFRFTGYNAAIGLAFIHRADTIKDDEIAAARKFCLRGKRPTVLLVFPRELESMQDICAYIGCTLGAIVPDEAMRTMITSDGDLGKTLYERVSALESRGIYYLFHAREPGDNQ